MKKILRKLTEMKKILTKLPENYRKLRTKIRTKQGSTVQKLRTSRASVIAKCSYKTKCKAQFQFELRLDQFSPSLFSFQPYLQFYHVWFVNTVLPHKRRVQSVVVTVCLCTCITSSFYCGQGRPVSHSQVTTSAFMAGSYLIGFHEFST